MCNVDILMPLKEKEENQCGFFFYSEKKKKYIYIYISLGRRKQIKATVILFKIRLYKSKIILYDNTYYIEMVELRVSDLFFSIKLCVSTLLV